MDHDRLLEAEQTVHDRLRERDFDFDAMLAISNIYRAAAAIRRRAERTVLAEHNLSWGGFTILWVLWVWGEMETAPLAAECDLAKGTLSGMVTTLENQGLVSRTRLASDRRRALVALTEQGAATMDELFPEFNQFERSMTTGLSLDDQRTMADHLRTVVQNANQIEVDDQTT